MTSWRPSYRALHRLTTVRYDGSYKASDKSDIYDADRVVAAVMSLTQLVRIRLDSVSYDRTDMTQLRQRVKLEALLYLYVRSWRRFFSGLPALLVELVRLVMVKLGDKGVEVTDAMTQLQTVVLRDVDMSAGSWGRFVSSLLNLPQSVSVRLEWTDIDRKTVDRIRTSPNVTVTRDEGRGEKGRYRMLEFTTSPFPT